MGLYRDITTDAGSTLSYWDYGIVEVNTSASKAEDQSANVNIWGYHDVNYYNNDAPLLSAGIATLAAWLVAQTIIPIWI